MIADNKEDEWLLAYIISNISERCYYASWMDDVEYILWYSLQEGPRRYGHDEISLDDITALKMLSDRCKCWIYFDDVMEETPIPLELWHVKYTEFIKGNLEKTARW
jgi:hypothetical protein